jgi:cyclopropane fatty-acyl-phospholipid synthase-like methyltransferase
MNDWKTIWNKNGLTVENTTNEVDDLMYISGYTGTGITYDKLSEFWGHVNKKFNIDKPSSFYEVGIGTGIALKILHEMGHSVGGSDYAKNSVERAKTLSLSNDIECLEASDVSPDPKYDYVASFGVFHYFSDLDYVNKVVEIMINKANKGIGIFDICDKEKESIYVETRKAYDSDYESKYAGLDHLFIDKSFWNDIALKNNLSIIVEDQAIPGYKNSKLRYNIYLTK